MGNRKPSVPVLLVLATAVAGTAILAGGRSILGAAQGSAESPRARLLVSKNPPRILFSTVDNQPVDYPRFLKTQAALIKSDMVLTAALRDPKVDRSPAIKDQRDPVAWLRKCLVVRNPVDTEILEIAMEPGCGASGDNQVKIVNAVKRAYMDEVVNKDQRRRTDRYDQITKLKQTYAALLKKKREMIRKLSEEWGSGVDVPGAAKGVLPRLYQDLRSRQVQFRLERAEAETLLERRKKAGARPDEITPLEDRLAVLTARQRVVDDELKRLARELQGGTVQDLDLAALKDEVAQTEDTLRKVGAEVEALKVELEARPRIQSIDDAHVTRS